MKLPIQTVVLLALAVLATVLVMRSCRPASESPSSDVIDSLKRDVRAKHTEILKLTAKIDSLTKKRYSDSLEIIVKRRAYNKEIRVLKLQASELRAKADSAIQRNPEIVAFVASQDSVISYQGARIDTLEQDLRVSQETAQELTQTYQTQIRIGQRLTGEQAQIITLLETDSQKLRKKVRNEKRLTAIIGVAAFVVGVFAAR